MATTGEMAKIRKLAGRRKIAWTVHADALTCGFYAEEQRRCRIYSVRPFACRAYGVVAEMACPFYPKATRISLPARDAFRRGLVGEGNKLLVEEFGDGGEALQQALEQRVAVESFAAVPKWTLERRTA